MTETTEYLCFASILIFYCLAQTFSFLLLRPTLTFRGIVYRVPSFKFFLSAILCHIMVVVMLLMGVKSSSTFSTLAAAIEFSIHILKVFERYYYILPQEILQGRGIGQIVLESSSSRREFDTLGG